MYNFLSLYLLFQAASVECGMATGCVKILRKALDFDHYGKFIIVITIIIHYYHYY